MSGLLFPLPGNATRQSVCLSLRGTGSECAALQAGQSNNDCRLHWNRNRRGLRPENVHRKRVVRSRRLHLDSPGVAQGTAVYAASRPCHLEGAQGIALFRDQVRRGLRACARRKVPRAELGRAWRLATSAIAQSSHNAPMSGRNSSGETALSRALRIAARYRAVDTVCAVNSWARPMLTDVARRAVSAASTTGRPDKAAAESSRSV